MKPLLFLLVGISIASPSSRPVLAVDAWEGEVQTVVSSLLEARGRLHRGEFRAVGERVVVRSDDPPEVTPSEVRCLFDRDANKERRDTIEQRVLNIASSSELTPEVIAQVRAKTYRGSPRSRPTVAMFTSTPEEMTEWHAAGSKDEPDHAMMHVQIRKPGTRPDGQFNRLFDPMAAGVFGIYGYWTGASLESLLLMYRSEATTVSVERLADDRIALKFVAPQLHRTIELDPSRGFVATRMWTTEFYPDGKEAPSSTESATADWREINDVWVPTRITMRGQLGAARSFDFTYDLEWISVNPATVDDTQFDYHSFEGVWEGTHVFDGRGAQTVHVDTIGRPFVQVFAASHRGKAGPPEPLTSSNRSSRVWLILNAAILAVVGVVLLIRGLRRSRTQRG